MVNEAGKKAFENLLNGDQNIKDLAEYCVQHDTENHLQFGQFRTGAWESAIAKTAIALRKACPDKYKEFKDHIVSIQTGRMQAAEADKRKTVIEMAAGVHDRKEEEKKKSVFLGGKDRPEFERHQI